MDSAKKILVIDDDALLSQLVKELFSQAGYQTHTAGDGPEGLRQFFAERPDLVILDLMLPEMDGWQVCHHIRQISDVPLIIMTALGQDTNIIQGLECGADDYIAKPISPKVLLARAKAALRRSALPPPTPKTTLYQDGYLTINLEKHQVLVRGEPVRLSGTEYRLLVYLFQHAGQVLTCAQILSHVWGAEYRDQTEYIHTYMWHLRQKLEAAPRQPVYLLTEHGVGYRFEKKAPQAV